MNELLRKKLEWIARRAEEITRELLEIDIQAETNRNRELQKEFSRVDHLGKLYSRWLELEKISIAAQEWLDDSSEEMRRLGREQIDTTQAKMNEVEDKILAALVPEDVNFGKNIYLEIRAGSGGDEAAIFCGDLFRMYHRYAEKKRWKMEIVSSSLAEHGGYKEIVCLIEGRRAWSELQFESGVHRVQRVPETESQGRIHTSAASVAVLPQAEDISQLELKTEDLRIDTFRASGAGGQHVNKTDSAIRITHLPTRTVVECQSERSQHKNKAIAMNLLQARLLKNKQQEMMKNQSELRRAMVGGGDRSERIRTYNFPQGRISDHRIDTSFHNLTEVMDGDIEEIVSALQKRWQIDRIEEYMSSAEA